VPFVRIFTPADELPFAGHPLVGAAWVLTVMGPGRMKSLRYHDGEARLRLDGDTVWIEVHMDGEVAPLGSAGDFLSRAGIGPVEDLRRVMMPKEYILARLPGAADVAALDPDMSVLAERFGTLAYARKGDTVRARFFAPDTAVSEDPATGSAAVALATTLAADGEDEGQLTIYQGEEIGYPSRIELMWGEGRAAIGGTVVRDEVRMLND
jgi:trans-2,3-dihydro-3-hydroxyanthranilate isomerase